MDILINFETFSVILPKLLATNEIFVSEDFDFVLTKNKVVEAEGLGINLLTPEPPEGVANFDVVFPDFVSVTRTRITNWFPFLVPLKRMAT